MATTRAVRGSTTSAAGVGLRVDVVAADEVAQGSRCGHRSQPTTDSLGFPEHDDGFSRPTLLFGSRTRRSSVCPYAPPPVSRPASGASERRAGPRRGVEAHHRAAPGGRPPAVRDHRAGGRAVRGGGPPAGPAAHRRRRHADRRRHRPAAGRLHPAGHDRHPRRGRRRAVLPTRSARCPTCPTSSPPPAASTCWPRSSARTTTTCSTCSCGRIRTLPGRHRDRDLRLSQAQQAALQLGNTMTTTAQTPHRHLGEPRAPTHAAGAAYADAARDHLWGHFTRQSAWDDRGPAAPIIVRGEGHRIWDDRGKEYIDGLAGLFTVQVGHGRTELAEAAAKQAEQLAYFPIWSYAHPRGDRAGRAAGGVRARRPQPGLLHHRRRRGGRDRVEAGQAVLQADRQADQAQGHQPRRRLPRHPAGRAVDHRHPGGQGDVRAAGARRVQGAQHQPSTARRSTCATTPRRSGAGPPTGSPRPSSSRAPRRWRRCSSSRCRTPAAASRRRPGTSSGCARSATSTTCCWSPTR